MMMIFAVSHTQEMNTQKNQHQSKIKQKTALQEMVRMIRRRIFFWAHFYVSRMFPEMISSARWTAQHYKQICSLLWRIKCIAAKLFFKLALQFCSQNTVQMRFFAVAAASIGKPQIILSSLGFSFFIQLGVSQLALVLHSFCCLSSLPFAPVLLIKK